MGGDEGGAEKGGMSVGNVVKFGTRLNCFLGVFSPEMLKDLHVFKNNTCFIVFSESHALGVRIEPKRIEIFDPLGFKSSRTVNFLFQFLKRHLPCRLLFVNTKIQAESSENCAYFVLLYLFYREAGYSMAEYLNCFSENFSENDTRVRDLFRGAFLTRN